MRLLTHADLAERFGLRWSRRWIRQLVNEGRFPRPVWLLGRLVWREDEITAWIDALPRRAAAPVVAFADAEPAKSSARAEELTAEPEQLPRRRRRATTPSAEGESAPAGTDQTQA
jgi:predicted DNA-binding transcriptional regulator AlpA